MIPDRYDLIRFYSNHFQATALNHVISEDHFDHREFAFKYSPLADSIGRPNLFNTIDDLINYMGTEGPNKAYVGGFYARKFPRDKKAQAKVRSTEWLGRELCWDIDMDHYMNIRKDMCDCGTEKKICDNCMELAKEAVRFLIKSLVIDFGISRDDIKVIFSGRQGFHVWVTSVTKLFVNKYNFPPKVSMKIESDLRQAIAEYLNLVTEKTRTRVIKGKVESKHIMSINVDSIPRQLRKRLFNMTFRNLVLKSPPNTLKEFTWIKEDKWNRIKSDLHDMSGYDVYMKHFSQLTPVKSRNMKELILKLRYPRYDIGCTKDTERIMKIPGSIDGSTGNMCMLVDDLDAFSLNDVVNIQDIIEH